MNYRDNSHPHGRAPQTPEPTETQKAISSAALPAFVPAAFLLLGGIGLMISGPAGQNRLIDRGWLVPASDAVVRLPSGVAGLDLARLTLPVGLFLIAMVAFFAGLSAYGRREQAAPYWFWQRDSFTALVVAVWATAWIPDVAHVPGWLGWIGALWCVAVAVGLGVLGVRINHRHADRGRLIEQIAPLLGSQPKNRQLVGLSKWSQEWPTGVPGKVVITYPNASLEYDEERKARVIALVSRIGWGPYRVDSLDGRKHQLVLVPGTDPNAAIAAWHSARSESF